MFEALKKRGWRGAVGLITAYAFVLQAFLAYSVASRAAVRGDNSGALTASAPLIAPDLVELPPSQPTWERWPFLSEQACGHFRQVRAGLSRAPPLHV